MKNLFINFLLCVAVSLSATAQTAGSKYYLKVQGGGSGSNTDTSLLVHKAGDESLSGFKTFEAGLQTQMVPFLSDSSDIVPSTKWIKQQGYSTFGGSSSFWQSITGGIGYSGGKVGIGTANPLYNMEVAGLDDTKIGIEINPNSHTSYLHFRGNQGANWWSQYASTGDELVYYNQQTGVMPLRMKAAGHVGINSAPTTTERLIITSALPEGNTTASYNYNGTSTALTGYSYYTQGGNGTMYGVKGIATGDGTNEGRSSGYNIGGFFEGIGSTGVDGYSLITGQGRVGFGTFTPDASSQLDITSTTRGVLLPRLSNTQMNAIPTPATGLLSFNTTDSSLYQYTGSTAGWSALQHNRGKINTRLTTEQMRLEYDANVWLSVSINNLGQVTFNANGNNTNLGFSDLLLGGNGIATNGSTISSNFYGAPSNVTAATTAGEFQIGGGTSTAFRSSFRGSVASTLSANQNYANVIVGQTSYTENGTGTHKHGASLLVKPLVVVNGGATTDTTSSVYVEGNSVGGNNNYALFVGTGVSRLAGEVQLNKTITAAGVTGNQTIDKTMGTVNIAAGGTSVTVTNNLVTANSIIIPQLRTNDATATIKGYEATAGSFTVYLTAAATAEVSIGFVVLN